MIEYCIAYLSAGIAGGFLLTFLPWSLSMIIRIALKIFFH